ncbi:Amidophosphoribosyltransferase [uncultured archaeon]|nr:Amidophosphoribosyltransferase [uncultured archaeon]
MCGIGAVVGTETGKAETLRKMLAQITHRGNSLYEMKDAAGCALGANRLEITGRNEGKQPKANEDGTIFAVFNGEIFNYKKLNAELRAAGHEIGSDCDTETLVHLYEQYGQKMVDRIDSEMFAFVIYDSKKGEVFAARDRWGVKPLYYAKDGAGTVYFGSEIKELAALPQVESVKLFPPGHYFAQGKLVRYYKHARKACRMGERAAAARLRHLLDAAVKKRVDTDLPIGVFLSGGLDSTAIVATAAKFHKDVTAIIVGNKDSEDAEFAKRYCRDYGIKHVVLSPPSEDEIFKEIKKIVYMAESFEPNVVRQSAISYFIARAAKDAGLRIVLCGEGADELFLGYPEFKQLGGAKISERQNSFLKSLHRTQFQRVDRTSMGSALEMESEGRRNKGTTVEVRVPFFDDAMVGFATSLPPSMMIRDGVEKYLLREAMRDRLPEYIRTRKKVVLSEGAGFGGNGPGGLFENLAASQISEAEFAKVQAEFPEWAIRTKEEAFYFGLFRSFGYCKAKFSKERVAANRIASLGKEAGKPCEERIADALSDSRFCRFRPRKPDELAGVVKKKLEAHEQIDFFMLWGIWKKEGLDAVDTEALDVLGDFTQEVRAVYPQGARVTFVLADTHAEINLLDSTRIRKYDSYAGLFERYARSKGYRVVRLSSIAPATLPAIGARALRRMERSELWRGLVAAAGKYYEGKDKAEGARAYAGRRLAEKPALEAHFRDAIFLTYNGPRHDAIAPDVPTLYIVPTGRGAAASRGSAMASSRFPPAFSPLPRSSFPWLFSCPCSSAARP